MAYWVRKFRLAFRGIYLGSAGQSSFAIHIPVGIAVLVLALWRECERWEWCILLLCIGFVISAELMNSAIEYLARGLCRESNRDVGMALDVASGAVLMASITAALVGGLVVFLR